MARLSISQIHSDPRGRTESEWLDTLDFLVTRLGSATSSHLHTGAYWCSDERGHESASIVARVRSRSPLPGVESDYWEAALCYTGGDNGAYSDAYAFPYLRGSALTSRGRLADGSPEEELDEFRHWQMVDGEFVDRGWGYPDGPGEWGWVSKPGDEYWQDLDVKFAAHEFAENQPIIARLCGLNVVRDPHSQFPLSRISLLHVNRGRETTNLAPWNEHPPRANSPHVIPIADCKAVKSGYELDLRKFSIRGGWKPGRYHIAMRAQYCNDPEEWSFRSDISPPFKITIM